MLHISHRRIKQIVVIIISLIAWSITAVAFLMGKQVNWAQLLLGVTGGLAVWICTYVITNWIDPSTGIHYRTTTDIYDVVTLKFLSLADKRRICKDSRFYSQYYLSSQTIKISGIANQGFFDYLLSKTWHAQEDGSHLLKLMANRPIKVEILIMNPICDIISRMDAREPPGRKFIHFNNIVRVLTLLKELYDEAMRGGIELTQGSKLDVRMCSDPLNTTLFYADNQWGDGNGGEIPSKGVLLMGMLYSHKLGDESQLFNVPTDEGKNTLYRDCIDHFDKMFELCASEQIALLEHGNMHFPVGKYESIKNWGK